MVRIFQPRAPRGEPGSYRSRIVCAWFFLCALIVPGNIGALINPPSPTADSSEASLDVSLSVATLFRISGIRDMNFGTYAGSGNLTDNDDICVWTNAAAGTYRVTARGNGGGASDYLFSVAKTGDATKTIGYTVRWNTQAGTSGNFALTNNVVTSNLSGANTESSTCASGASATANFQVQFTEDDLLDARSGTYLGTLTLIISAPT